MSSAHNEYTQAFVLRLDDRLDTSLRDNVIGLGWSRANGLDIERDWDKFKRIIRTAYPELYADNNRSLGNAAGSMWRFFHEMRVGDVVVVPVPGSQFRAAEVTSPPYFVESAVDVDFAWRRSVKWLTASPVPRSHAPNSLQKRMKARQTAVDATDLLAEIGAALRATHPISFRTAVLSGAKGVVAQAIQESVTDAQLEDLVMRLARTGGAHTFKPPKNSGKPGDADVIATYDLRIANQDSTVKVAYQVKQHQGESDESGVQQLLDRMAAEPDIAHGVFVTAADKVSERARTLAEENDIIVLAEAELVEWILSVGLARLDPDSD